MGSTSIIREAICGGRGVVQCRNAEGLSEEKEKPPSGARSSLHRDSGGMALAVCGQPLS